MWSRRGFLRALSTLGAFGCLRSRRALTFGASSAFGIARLRYDGGSWNPRPDALDKLLQEIEKRTSILIDARCPAIFPAAEDLFEFPFATLAGDQGFEPFAEASRRNLQTYLRTGGTLLVDSCEEDPEGSFYQAVVQELAAILPGISLNRIPSSHVLYQSFYLIDQPAGRTLAAPYLQACQLDERLLVIYSHNDLMGAWAKDNFGNWLYEVHPGGERQREMAFRLGVNLAMYVLCQDYKEDQVHIPFILHRRQWRLE